MPLPSRNLNIFIASPSELLELRDSADKIISYLSRLVKDQFGLSLSVLRWENNSPNGDYIQSNIYKKLKKSDLFIMIIGRTLGNVNPEIKDDCYQSSTVREYRIVQEVRDFGHINGPEIFSYFEAIKDKRLLKDPGPQLSKVLEFKKEVSDEITYRIYESNIDFGCQLRDDLLRWLLKQLKNSDSKKLYLKDIFELACPGNKSTPKSLIIHPQIDSRPADPKRLLPYMALEDFQAIDKITKCINIAEYDVSSKVSVNFNSEFEREKNKFFVCLRRNYPAQECLKKTKNLRFNVDFSNYDRDYNSDSERSLYWKSIEGEDIHVISPQGTYLSLQRDEDDSSWESNYGMCSAVDFGVFAKFDNPESLIDPYLKGLKNFFVFGLRGLGTWGAAWYLDYRYRQLHQDMDPQDGTIQVLLKITYSNNQIHSVEDVSQENQDFFDKENNLEYIKMNIQALSKGFH